MKELTYQQAAEQLEAIVGQIEQGELSIDELVAKVKEATELLNLCKSKLQQTDASIEKMISDIDL